MENHEYKVTEERIEEIYRSYPKVMAVLDTESACALNEQKCGVLIEAVELRGRLNDMQQERSTSEVATTAWTISKRQEFYNETAALAKS